MSQSDYIQYTKSVEVLGNIKKNLTPILNPSDYTAYTTYNLETTVKNTKTVFSKLDISGNQRIFDMEKKPPTCISFPLCINTNSRANRVLNSVAKMNGVAQPAIPTNRSLPGFKPNANKTFVPTKCTFRKGYIIRSVSCSKDVCKCRTRYIDSHVITNKPDIYTGKVKSPV
jgi:hypothetical protein